MKFLSKNSESKFELFNNLYGNFEIHVYPYGDGVEVKGRVGPITIEIGQIKTTLGKEEYLEIHGIENDYDNLDLKSFRLERLLKKTRKLLKYYLTYSKELSKPELIKKEILLASGALLPHIRYWESSDMMKSITYKNWQIFWMLIFDERR